MDHARLPDPVVIDRSGEILTFTLNNAEAGNEVTAPMFDAMIAALRTEATMPMARVLRIRARGEVFCAGRERAGTTAPKARQNHQQHSTESEFTHHESGVPPTAAIRDWNRLSAVLIT